MRSNKGLGTQTITFKPEAWEAAKQSDEHPANEKNAFYPLMKNYLENSSEFVEAKENIEGYHVMRDFLTLKTDPELKITVRNNGNHDLEIFLNGTDIENRHFSGTIENGEELRTVLKTIGVKYTNYEGTTT